jgi:hypothetical protein
VKSLRVPLATVDFIAILGTLLLAIGVAVRLGPDIAVALVGGLLLVYAVLASRTEP